MSGPQLNRSAGQAPQPVPLNDSVTRSWLTVFKRASEIRFVFWLAISAVGSSVCGCSEPVTTSNQVSDQPSSADRERTPKFGVMNAEPRAGGAQRSSTSHVCAIVVGRDSLIQKIVIPNETSVGKRLQSVRTSCGCVSAKLQPESIVAHGTAELEVQFSPPSMQNLSGETRRNHKCVLLFNNGDEHTVHLDVCLRPYLSVKHESELRLGEIPHGKGHTHTVGLVLRERGEQPPMTAVSSGSDLTTPHELEWKRSVQHSTPEGDVLFETALNIDVLPSPVLGHRHAVFMVNVMSPDKDTYTQTVTLDWWAVSHWRAEPSRVVIRELRSAAMGHATIRLTHAAGSRFNVVNASSTHDGLVTCKIDNDRCDMRHEIELYAEVPDDDVVTGTLAVELALEDGDKEVVKVPYILVR